MRFYSARETSHPGVFAVRQTDRQSGESREVEAYIVCVELQGGRDRYYFKAGGGDRSRPPAFLRSLPLPSLADAVKDVEAMVEAGTVGVHEENKPLHARPSLETKGVK